MSGAVLASRYSFDGLSIALSGAYQGATAIYARLRYLAADGEGPADLTLALHEGAEGPQSAARPTGRTRPVLDLPGGEGVYVEEEDILYVDYHCRARARCALRRGIGEIAVADEQPANVWLATHPVLTIALSELLKRQGRYRLHAAGLTLNGKALVLAGRSGCGKTTLAVALLRAGFGFLGGDSLFLAYDSGGLRVLGFPDGVDLGVESLRFFPELHHLLAHPTAPGWPKRQADVLAIYGAAPVRSCRPALLILPQVAADGRTIISPLERGAALLELVPNVLLTEAKSSGAHLAALAALVRASRCYRLAAGRDFDAIAALLRRLLQ